MSAEKAAKLLRKIQQAQRAYNTYLGIKNRAIHTKEQMEPIVENIKEGMRIGHGIGKVLNDEVTRDDVRWVFRVAQNRVVTGFERAVHASKKNRKKRRPKKPSARTKSA